ncbi:MAG: hypothetical protein Tsb009_00950 [Planctomycetaceae bacterium]
MTANGKHDQFKLGFLEAIELPDGGYVGGLLVTNRLGRPLEFQCTAPVRANRTQEILYGPTLQPFLLTDLIGKTLVEKAGVKPELVLTENESLLLLREQVSTPIASLQDTETSTGFQLGRHRLRFHEGHTSDAETIQRKSHLVPQDANLREPFERVREALQEAIVAGGMK